MTEAVPLHLSRLGVVAFRNLEPASFEFGARLNVIAGENGQGKTSLIEAIYLLCTTRSFRTSKLGEVIRGGCDGARVKGTFERGGLPWVLEAALTARGRSFKKNGSRPAERLGYVQSTPVVAFHPGDLALVTGGATLRRKLLDRLIIHLEPRGIEAKRAYDEAAKRRLSLLEMRGSPREIEPFEQIMAERGSELSGARAIVAIAVEGRLSEVFQRLARQDLAMSVSFRAGGTEDPELFRQKLAESRAIDARRKMTTFGPERDELLVNLDGRAARSFGSQGQQRMVALSLKLAELELIRQATATCPILLLDDVSSELDRDRTAAVFRFLEGEKNQVFVTTTRPELFTQPRATGAWSSPELVATGDTELANFYVEGGRIERRISG